MCPLCLQMRAKGLDCEICGYVHKTTVTHHLHKEKYENPVPLQETAQITQTKKESEEEYEAYITTLYEDSNTAFGIFKLTCGICGGKFMTDEPKAFCPQCR